MKTIFRSLGMGVLLTGVMAVGAYAQEPAACAETGAADAQAALQDKIRESYAKDKKTAIDAGKQLLEKYGSCAFSAEFVAWLNPQLPKWEASIKDAEVAAVRSAILKRFDAAIPAKNWDEAYKAGEEFFAKFPNDPAKINIMIPLATIGVYESYPPAKNYKYNDATLKYAKAAIADLKAGVKHTKENKQGVPVYGAFQFEATKDDAISELTYGLAYITYWAKGDKKGALPYYYEAVQSPGLHKDDAYIYETLGAYYVDGAAPLGTEIASMIEKLKASTDDAEKTKLDAEIKGKIALFNGYTERALDAFARAHKSLAAKTDAESKKRRDGIYTTLQNLYKRRFDKDAGLDAYLATTVAKPLPNPTTDVQPVVEEPTTDTNTNTTTTATPAPAKPVATTPTKPLSTNTVKVGGATAAKKGTR